MGDVYSGKMGIRGGSMGGGTKQNDGRLMITDLMSPPTHSSPMWKREAELLLNPNSMRLEDIKENLLNFFLEKKKKNWVKNGHREN
jgi:hypothetical protein